MDTTIPFSSDNSSLYCENNSSDINKKKPLQEPLLSVAQTLQTTSTNNNETLSSFEVAPTLISKDIISNENSNLNSNHLNSGIINNAFNNSNSGCSNNINDLKNISSNNNEDDDSILDKTIDEKAQQQSDSQDDDSTFAENSTLIPTLLPKSPKPPIRKKSNQLQEPEISDDESDHSNEIIPETPENDDETNQSNSNIKRNVSDLEDLLKENNQNLNKKNDKLFVPETPEKDEDKKSSFVPETPEKEEEEEEEHSENNIMQDNTNDDFIKTKRSKSQNSNYYSYEELNKNKRKTVSSEKPNQDEVNPNDELSGEFINSKKLKTDHQQQFQQSKPTSKKQKKFSDSITKQSVKGLDLEESFDLDNETNNSNNNNSNIDNSNNSNNNIDNNNIEILPPKATNRKILLNEKDIKNNNQDSKSKSKKSKRGVDQANENIIKEHIINEDTDNEKEIIKSKKKSTSTKLDKKKSSAKNKQQIIEEQDIENSQEDEDNTYKDNIYEDDYINDSNEDEDEEEEEEEEKKEEEQIDDDEDTDLENDSNIIKKSVKSTNKKKSKDQKTDLFKGFNFLLTGVGENNIGKIEKIILKGKGKLFNNSNSFFDLKKKMINDVPNKIILSPECVTTVKYLRGIVEKVDCLNVNWIIESSQDSELKPYEDYILPLGKSLLNDKFIYPNSKFNVGEIFSDFRFELSTSNRKGTFKEDWSLILKKCGAKIVQRMLNIGRIDAYLLDGHVGNYLLLEVSRNTGVPIVSTKWVFQSIIHQKKLDYNLHSSFLILDNTSHE